MRFLTAPSAILFALLLALLLAQPSLAQIPVPPDGEAGLAQQYTGRSYSPYAERDFPSNVYWGDTHLHTSYSMDAGAFGNRLGLDDAYRFARGEQVTASGGQKAKLSRPLDYLVIADHSDNMGFFPDLFAGQSHILSDPTGQDWYDRINAGKGVGVAMELIGLFSQGEMPDALLYRPDSAPYRSAWDKTVAAAERFNDPGKFTAFIGYEWTSLVKGNNMHRVVIYRDGGDLGGQMVPFTTYPPEGSINPRDLWTWMAGYEESTGGRLLAIPHNGNLSNGIMFPLEAQYDGRVLDAEYVTKRAHWEPLYEVTQSAPTSTASRSSRAGSVRTARPGSRSTTWSGRMTGKSAATSACPPSETPSMPGTPTGPTPSVRPSWERCGRIQTSTASRRPSITRA